MKTAVITGSSGGFGQLVSVELAKEGYRVFATLRDLNKKNQLLQLAKKEGVEEKIQLLELDVASDLSVKAFKQQIRNIGNVDILINNAGFAYAGFSEEITLDNYRKQFETNVFGAIAVTQAVLPLMREQRYGKIINISSISGRIGFPGLSPYVASKHALEGWSESLRLEMKPFGISVVLVEPGSFHTNIWSAGKQIAEKSLQKQSPYYQTMIKLENYLSRNTENFGDPLVVAKLITSITKKQDPKLRYTIGKGVNLALALKWVLPWNLWEKIMLNRLNKGE